MHVLVLGAGVTGLATAWYLREDGHTVTVVERNEDVALESSFANGGQLSYSYVAPLAGPGVLSKLPSWLLRGDSPIRFRPRLDPDQWRWLAQFVCACTQRKSELSTRRLLALSFLSRDLMRQLQASEPDLRFSHSNAGKLVVHRKRASFDAALRLLDYQRSLGCEQQALDTSECVQKEPALAHLAGQLQGGIFTSSEDSGDCYQFCVELTRLLRARGVEFRLGTNVTALRHALGGPSRVEALAGDKAIDADQIVLAAGAASAALLKPLGVRVPLYPLKGYSLTTQVDPHGNAPHISITDFERKIVYARLGDRLRIAGMADVTGRRADVDPSRVATLRAESAAAFPDAGNFDEATVWCGLRPATPHSTPIIDSTRYENLWLNLGQGALGFTLALASGRSIADLIAKRPPAVPLDGFTL
ncbi:D-amino acid dehydrogenase [Caballeronia sordidicola]|uniref:D-amino acid dehydrogenase n=1 Tax=Caballeronia sordidicola TaxID=196367 RepID=UPI0004D01C78|nr:D-amino acid dehydrogenase [Caballeronia sordidicola]